MKKLNLVVVFGGKSAEHEVSIISAKNVYLDMVKTVELVRASDLDWTVVRVPMLTDDPPKGQVRVGMVGDGMGPRITRADMAEYILQQVKSPQQLRRAPAISN